MKKNHQSISKQFISTLKLNKGCAICGYSTIASALDFHHINEEGKEKNISRLTSIRAFSEMKKCVVLCSRCHREVHSGMHSMTALHRQMITQEDLGFTQGKWGEKRLDLRRDQAIDDARANYNDVRDGNSRKEVALKILRRA